MLTVLVFNKSEINVFDAKSAWGLSGLFPTKRMEKGELQSRSLHMEMLDSALHGSVILGGRTWCSEGVCPAAGSLSHCVWPWQDACPSAQPRGSLAHSGAAGSHGGAREGRGAQLAVGFGVLGGSEGPGRPRRVPGRAGTTVPGTAARGTAVPSGRFLRRTGGARQ